MPSTINAKALQPGDTIAFISPSARLVDHMPDVIARATNMLEDKGYTVKNLYNRDAGVQSGIKNRLSEIREAFFDPTISGIICTIGGSTFTELLPDLMADTELHAHIRANPKVVIGYSDISGLHWFLHAYTGLRTFYGPCPLPELGDFGPVTDDSTPLAFCVKQMFRAVEAREPLGDIPRSPSYALTMEHMFSEPATTKRATLAPSPAWTWLSPGRAQGRLFGGCLTVIVRLHGVRSLVPDWRGRIVFVETAMADHDEEKGNPLPRVRAAFADLIAAGIFEEAAGLVVGRPYGYNSDQDRADYAGVIKELLCEGRLAAKDPFPILMNVDIGHTTPMVTLPFDAMAELDSEKDRFAVLESAVV
jgi:muramoyltetrapeptide carboxypeptidase LdcA involved in peptidoglycan recycling